MNKINNIIDDHFENLDQIKFLNTASKISKINELRKSGMDSFLKYGFPAEISNSEKWKFSNINPIAREKFSLVPHAPKYTTTSFDNKLMNHPANTNRLVFINGELDKNNTDISSIIDHCLITTFNSTNLESNEIINNNLGNLINIENDIFSAINSAFLNDGLLIYVKKGAQISQPISIIFITTNQNIKIATFPRILVICEEDSTSSIIEGHISYSNQPSLNAPVVEIQINNNANLNHYRYMIDTAKGFHIGNTKVSLGEQSQYNSLSFSTGSKLARNAVEINMNEKYSYCNLNGLYITKDKNHIDNHININHKNTHTKSNIFYKGILKDSSRAVFSGRVLVERNAQKTQATQSDKNLLLSPNVRINTKPSLEIYADDVQCGHGATASYFADDAMFYMQSRGINKKASEQLLIKGFANEILEQIPSSLIRKFFYDILIHRSI